MGFELVKAVFPALSRSLLSPALSSCPGHIVAKAASATGKFQRALGLVHPFFLFLPLLSEAEIAVSAGRAGLGRGMPCPPPPTRRAFLSVCLSVCPHLAATAAPLPVVCGSCPSKALPSPPRSSWRSLGTAGRAPLTAHASPAPEAGRESRQGEPRQPHAAGTLEFSCPNKLQIAAFWGKTPMALRARWFLLRALGTPDAAQFGMPRSRQLDGFHLLPLHLIFARLQAANCSPVAWPASVLLYEPGFIRTRLTPRG